MSSSMDCMGADITEVIEACVRTLHVCVGFIDHFCESWLVFFKFCPVTNRCKTRPQCSVYRPMIAIITPAIVIS